MSRDDLYKQVWSKAASRLAKEWGISDVAIAKLRKKHSVPKPPTGYWARIQYGQKIRRPRLPKLDDERLQIVRFQRWGSPEDRTVHDAETASNIAAEKATENQIVVAAALIDPHPLVERTNKSIASATADDRGIVRPKAKSCLDVAVGKNNIDRAMRIMDALVKALEARGFPVAVEDSDENRATVVTVGGEPLKIGLSEKTDCKKRPPTPAQFEQLARYAHAYIPTIYDYTPSGKLKLSILTGGYDNLRRNWSDLVHQRIENCLNRFVAALIKVAEQEKADRIESERRERAWEEERRRREDEARRAAEEKARVEDLDGKVAAWHKIQKVHAYLAAFESVATQKRGSIEPSSRLGLWLQWAKARANALDPIEGALRQLSDEPADAE